MRGIIKLFNEKDELITCDDYNGKYDRHRVIEKWEERYTSSMDRYYIQILPYANTQRVRNDGTNYGSQDISVATEETKMT